MLIIFLASSGSPLRIPANVQRIHAASLRCAFTLGRLVSHALCVHQLLGKRTQEMLALLLAGS